MLKKKLRLIRAFQIAFGLIAICALIKGKVAFGILMLVLGAIFKLIIIMISSTFYDGL